MSPNFGCQLQPVLIRISDLRGMGICNWRKNRGQGGAGTAKAVKGKEIIRGQHHKWCNFWQKFGDKFGDTVFGKKLSRRPTDQGSRQIPDSKFQTGNGSFVGPNWRRP